MESTSKLSSIINFYTEKSNSPFLDFRDFCVLVRKYAEMNISTQADLVKYLDNTASTVSAELQGLAEKGIASVITNSKKKKIIISFTFMAKSYLEKYDEILRRCSVPYPIAENLPKQIPINDIPIVDAGRYITELIDESEKAAQNSESIPEKLPILYILDFSGDIPSLILPAEVSIFTLLNTAQQKIRKILKKEEYHDYCLKKLRSTNPTKEISIRNFYSEFVDTEDFKYTDFSEGDLYYLWNQTLYYIRQDFEKIQDRTLEDINALQACRILEIQSSYLKEKMQNKQKREEAINQLDGALLKSPYFFSMQQILKFQDNNGRLLYGRYTEEDLKDFLHDKTTDEVQNKLPSLLVFRVASGTKYYIYKKNVAAVIIRLCDEAHVSIENYLQEKWYNSLIDFKKLPEMTDEEEFDKCLHTLVEEKSPVLHALLNANFMSLFISENSENPNTHLFPNGHLKPYKDLLMLYNENLFAIAKSRLPFYYNIPVISWILKFLSFLNKKQNKNSTSDIEENSNITTKKTVNTTNKTRKLSKESEFAAKANEIATELIPEGSTLNRELDYLIKQWNMMISKDAYNNLINDVNNLIRDYIRRVMRTLSVNTFTKERVNELANNLINTPNMKKISDKNSLREYVILYILKLVTNY